MTSLKTLNLGLEGCQNVKTDGLIELWKGVSRTPSLQSIKANLTRCPVADQGFCNIDEMLTCKELKSIDLNFTECQEVTGQAMADISNFLRKQAGLQNISLNFLNCNQIRDAGMMALGGGLKGQADLKNLTLMFEGCGITDTGFASISEGINGLRSLEKIYFDFSW